MNKLLCLILLSSGVCAQPVTYEFTGDVTSASGIYAAAGSTVSGTFTIDIGRAPVSTSIPWYSETDGGAYYGGPVPQVLAFSSSLTSGSVNFSNSTGSPFGVASVVQASDRINYTSGAPNSYYAQDLERNSDAILTDSGFVLTGGTPFDAYGLPVLALATTAHGFLLYQTPNTGMLAPGESLGDLQYTITSMRLASSTASVSAPELDATSTMAALTLLLGSLAVLRGNQGSGKIRDR